MLFLGNLHNIVNLKMQLQIKCVIIQISKNSLGIKSFERFTENLM